MEKYDYNENGVLKDDGELSLLWCISDDYFINRDYLSETEVIDILASRGIKEQQAKIFYEKCFTFSHNPDILFSDNTMYYWKVNENLKEWVKANEFNLRVGINPAIILSTWKWESGYGQGNCFGALGGTKENFEQQTITCIARYLRFFYFYQFNLIESNEKSKLDMNISKEKFSLTPCNAAMYSRAQYNNDTMIELQKWHDTIIDEDW